MQIFERIVELFLDEKRLAYGERGGEGKRVSMVCTVHEDGFSNIRFFWLFRTRANRVGLKARVVVVLQLYASKIQMRDYPSRVIGVRRPYLIFLLPVFCPQGLISVRAVIDISVSGLLTSTRTPSIQFHVSVWQLKIIVNQEGYSAAMMPC